MSTQTQTQTQAELNQDWENALARLRAADAACVAEVKRLRSLGWSEAQIDAHVEQYPAPEPWMEMHSATMAENKAMWAKRGFFGPSED